MFRHDQEGVALLLGLKVSEQKQDEEVNWVEKRSVPFETRPKADLIVSTHH